MSEVIRDVMYNVGDSINGGGEMNLVVPLINEFIIDTHCERNNYNDEIKKKFKISIYTN